jgi:hypothetical protein
MDKEVFNLNRLIDMTNKKIRHFSKDKDQVIMISKINYIIMNSKREIAHIKMHKITGDKMNSKIDKRISGQIPMNKVIGKNLTQYQLYKIEQNNKNWQDNKN